MPAIVNSNNVFLGSNGGGSVNYTAGKYIDISENIISVSGLEPYTAGQNIDITDNVISGKDWTTDINNASSYAYEQATAHGVEYSGIAPIDVNNTTHQISADVWTLSGTSGIEILEDSENKVTTLRVSGDYATTSDLNAYVPLTGITDNSYFGKLNPEQLYFSSKYNNNTSSYAYYNNSIHTFVRSADMNQYVGGVNLSQTALELYQSSAYGSGYSGTAYLTPNGLQLRSVYGTTYIGPNNYDLLSVYTSGNNAVNFITFNRGNGPSYSSENTGIGQFFVATTSDMNVPRYNPVWIVKNGSGDGFSIGASEAKGFDKDGNTIWSTKMSKATQLIHGGTDPNPAILITPLQTTTAYTAQWSSAPYVSADYNSLSISYGPTASVPNIKIKPDGITVNYTSSHALYTTADATVSRYTAANDPNRIDWSLTGSVQKREIECDTATSAITAIAGSAIGGIAGDTIDLSAGEGISIVETANKVVISNNISAGSNMSFVYDSETNKIRIDANDAFPITATDGNTTWSADCKASAFTMGRNTSRTDIGAFGFEYRQAPSVNVSGSWYDLALLMEKFKYAIPVEAVANSGMATGQNILYVVTGS